MDFENRDFMMQFNPEVYHITDHYRKYPYVLLRLDLVDQEELKNHFERIWRMNVTKKMLEQRSNEDQCGNIAYFNFNVGNIDPEFNESFG
jgi:hypothetical protein